MIHPAKIGMCIFYRKLYIRFSNRLIKVKVLSKSETPSEKPKGPQSFHIKAEIAFIDKPPMKESLTVKAESEDKALEETFKQLQKQHPKAKTITLNTATKQKKFKIGKK